MVLATGFVIWYMTLGYRVGTYPQDTRLGNVYIGGLSEADIVPLLDERITFWYNDDSIVFELVYQDYTYEFDRDLMLFDLTISTYNIDPGEENVLLVQYQTEDLQMIRDEMYALPFLDTVKDNIDYTELIRAILEDASYMKTYSSQNVEDYFIDDAVHVTQIESIPFSVPTGVQIDSVIADLNEAFTDGHIPVYSKRLFDVLDVLGDILTDEEISTITPAMLETIWHTNFIVNEVHYDNNIDLTQYTVDTVHTHPKFGKNAVVNRIDSVNEGFSFYNPNDLAYYFTIEKVDNSNAILHLHGNPFEYTITTDVQVLPIDFITEQNLTIRQDGAPGAVVEVVRTITDIYGDVVEETTIIFEFYPPVKEIRFQP
jgi:hypothetical protein